MHANRDDFIVVMASVNGDSEFLELVTTHVNFSTVDSHIIRGGNADADAVALNGDYRHANVAVDDDFFARPT